MKRLSAFLILAVIVTTGCARTQQRSCRVVEETYVHKYGVEVPKQDWSSRGQHGQVISTLDNGVTVKKNYSSGQLQGDSTYTFPHSEVVERLEHYENGNKVKETYYTLAGNPQREITFGDQVTQVITVWFDDGTPQSKETYRNDYLVEGEYYTTGHRVESRVDNGNGTRLVRDAYGQLQSTDTIENGQMVLRTTYHANGNPREVIPYRQGLVEGTRKTFYPAGEPELVEEWVAGAQEGIATLFQNGEKYADIPYTNGKKQGVEKHYRNGEIVVEEIAWSDDERHGPSSTYIDGNPVKEEWYFNGRLVPKGIYDIKMNRAKRTSDAS